LYLFDTNAISEVLRPRPNPEFVRWLDSLPTEHQFTSIVVVAELYAGAYHSAAPSKWLRRIEETVFPSITILDFDLECAHQYGRIYAQLALSGIPVGDVDTQIAATAQRHDLTVVTANVKHFENIPGLRLRAFTAGTGGRGAEIR
jgi:predicted nucleic acid-binding protein